MGMAFSRLEEGYENAMKEYNRKQVAQLNTLISMLIGQLSPGDRQKVMTICTIDVHARDVVAKIIAQKVSVLVCFQPFLNYEINIMIKALKKFCNFNEDRKCFGCLFFYSSLFFVFFQFPLSLSPFPHSPIARWRTLRRSYGCLSYVIAGMRRRDTASPTSVTPSSSIHTSTWATHHDLS